MRSTKLRLIHGILMAAMLASPSFAVPQQSVLASDAGDEASLVEARRELVEKTSAYQARLEARLPILEAALAKRAEQVTRMRPLLEKGYIARVEFEKAERERASAERLLSEIRTELETTRQIALEAEAQLQAARREEDERSVTQAAQAVVRFRGNGLWTLAETVSVANFFWKRFGRELPISAYGQTPTHDALGFDHRGQIDVAVHPGSPEGRALIDFLKERSISFVGFSGAVEGTATGAHIHVGEPSPRLF